MDMREICSFVFAAAVTKPPSASPLPSSPSPCAAAGGQFLRLELNPGPTLAANPDALAAFQRAAAAWESVISSPIHVNINADLVAVDNPFVIGSTSLGPGNPNLDYTTVRNAMAAQVCRRLGDSILASLLTRPPQLTANVPATGAFDNTTIGVTTANQKALGLIANPLANTQVDGQVVFNLQSFFRLQRKRRHRFRTRWISKTAATHEIGHVLGFLSDTDDYDSDETITDNATTLDLFRFDAAHPPTTATQFAFNPRQLMPGAAAVFLPIPQSNVLHVHRHITAMATRRVTGRMMNSSTPTPTPSPSAQRSASWIQRLISGRSKPSAQRIYVPWNDRL